MKTALVMIVKNEQENIVRALESVKDQFEVFVINYSGTDDETVEVGTEWMEANGKDGMWISPEWKGAADGLNACIEFCENLEVDWILRMDADTVYEGPTPDFENLNELCDAVEVDIIRADGSFIASRPWWFKPNCKYRGVRHEGLYANFRTKNEDIFIRHHDDSGARPRSPETYADDFHAMGNELPVEYDADMAKRYCFYMANSARDGGDLFQAALWFRIRMLMGGYESEVQVATREHALIIMQAPFWLDAIHQHPTRPDMVFWALATGDQFGTPFKAQVLEIAEPDSWITGQMFCQDEYMWKALDSIALVHGELGHMEKHQELTEEILSKREEYDIPDGDLVRLLSRIGLDDEAAAIQKSLAEQQQVLEEE